MARPTARGAFNAMKAHDEREQEDRKEETDHLLRTASEQAAITRQLLDRSHSELADTQRAIEESQVAIAESLRLLNKIKRRSSG